MKPNNISREDLAKWIQSNLANVTDAQTNALSRVRSRWEQMGEPELDFLNGCVMVSVGGEVNPMVLGIEKDGYTHS